MNLNHLNSYVPLLATRGPPLSRFSLVSWGSIESRQSRVSFISFGSRSSRYSRAARNRFHSSQVYLVLFASVLNIVHKSQGFQRAFVSTCHLYNILNLQLGFIFFFTLFNSFFSNFFRFIFFFTIIIDTVCL